MRSCTLFLAAIATNIYAVHAVLPPNSVSSSEVAAPNSLRDEKHNFHHFDRNPITAQIGRDTGVHGNNVEGSGVSFEKRERERDLAGKEQKRNNWQSSSEPVQQAKRWKMTKEGRVLNTRFIKNPDYSQGGNGGGGGDGSNSASPAASPTPNSPPAKHAINPTVSA
ncbi:hypothetical protein F5I97DRAFT_1925482 [Phlebopus sp. FC_14]|nr:hypothetical protein F5I97DRAFT_1925482 [Phlebopus sp. FC_14]